MFGSATIQVVRGGACNELRNPLIVAEGLDTGLLAQGGTIGDSDINSFFQSVDNSGSSELENFLINNTAIDYDIIYVKWNNGTDFIQRNAFVLEAVIAWVNANKTGSNKNVVLGQSMGGLIARYALRDMENTGLNHDTSLYISHDAPHQGAHIPVGMLHMARHVVNEFMQTPLGNITIPVNGAGNVGLATIDDLLDAPAINQMLLNSVDTNGNRTNTNHVAWQNELRLFGYPQQTRNIALSNASHCGFDQGLVSNQELVTATGNGGTSFITSFLMYLFINLDPLIGVALNDVSTTLLGFLPGNSKLDIEFRVNASPSSGIARIYKGRLTYEKKLLWLVKITRTIFDESVNSQNGDRFIDNYPGGVTPNGLAISESDGDSNLFYNYDYNLNINLNFDFIPVTSALDVGSGYATLSDSDYYNKYTAVNPPTGIKSIPFVNFTTSFNENNGLNAEHISFNRRNGDWLASEIDNNLTNAQVFNCSFVCSNTSLSGPANICTSGSYSVPPGATSYIWSRSGSGSATLTSNGNTATLTRNGQQSGMVTITVRISSPNCSATDIIISKEVWVGTLKYNSLENITYGGNQFISPLPENGCGTNRFQVNFWPSNDLVQEVQYQKITTDVYWHRDFFTDTSRNVYLYSECNKPFQFKVRARNSCGWSEWFELTYNIESCPENCIPPFNGIIGTNFILAPNPVTNGTLNVSVKSDAPWFTVPGSGGNPSLDPGQIGGGSGGLIPNIRVGISIYNQMGILVQSNTSVLMPATLNISNLPAGTYLVVFQYMTQTESHTIIKQ